MTSPVLATVVWLVRTWTRVYTWNLDSTIRDDRRAEIDSDIWEQVHAPDASSMVAFEILGRLLLGLSADVQWRFEQGVPTMSPRLVIRALLASTLLVVTVWTLFFSQPRTLPTTVQAPPPMRILRADAMSALPPPPPPPLCTPNTAPNVKCTKWP